VDLTVSSLSKRIAELQGRRGKPCSVATSSRQSLPARLESRHKPGGITELRSGAWPIG
jgi:hypothetical protein